MAGKRIVVFSLFVLLALAFTMFTAGDTSAQSYKAYGAYALQTRGGGDTADVYNTTAIPRPNYNYEDSSMLTFTPIDGWAAQGDMMPIGAYVGTLDASVFIGKANGACATDLSPVFDLYNASTDTSDILGPTDMYFVLKNYITVPIPYSKYDPTIPDYLEGYPGFLNNMFDPDGAGPLPPLQPRARYAGHTTSIADMNILIQVVVFNPGQLEQLGGIYANMGAALGRPSLVALNNPVTQEEAPGAISDFCTPLSTVTTNFGLTQVSIYVDDSDGLTNSVNPQAGTGILGTHIARTYSRTERDADSDGWENDYDSCHYTNDANWDQAKNGGPGTGDHDNDGLPDSCDPDPRGVGDPDTDDCVGGQSDCDGDGYLNRQDICPLEANGCKTSSCGPTYNPAWDNQNDADGVQPNADLGPGPDSLGDTCDDSDDDGNEDGAGAGTCNDGLDNRCVNGANDDSGDDSVINDGCRAVAVFADCDKNQDGDCTDVGPPDETTLCANGADDDADTVINDGCPKVNSTSEADGTDGNDSDCNSAMDDTDTTPWGANPGTGIFYHDLPWAAVCVGAADTDLDGYCDALEDELGSSDTNGSEADKTVAGVCDPDPGGTYPSCCNNALDDDGDSYVNDGCPRRGRYAEIGAECAIGDSDSDDTPTKDIDESPVRVNDGCPVIGVPESLVIDAAILAGTSALPAQKAAQSCSDGIDNDGDGSTDVDNQSLGCASGHTSYASDPDHDGQSDNPDDNCPGVYNPEQTDTDNDTVGDVCDPDDDNDGFDDVVEWWVGTDPLASCPTVAPNPEPPVIAGHDAWPLDNSRDTYVTVIPDIYAYRGNVNKLVGDDNSLRRLDLNADGYITVIPDIYSYRGNVNTGCT